MSDNEEFARWLAETKARWTEIGARDQALDTEHQVTARRLEEMSGQHCRLAELALAADGRTQEVAAQELEAAQEDLEGTLAGKGAAEAAEQQARGLLDAAESGQDLASAQLRVLAQAGLPAAALLDVVDLDDAQRPGWEPGLALYRDAVVVHRDQGPRARGQLAGLPGSTLILADEPDMVKPTALPASADPRFDLAVFLTAIGRRADGSAAMTDAEAGVIVLGGLPDPITGRAARIAAARQDHADKAALLNEAVARLVAARKILKRAEERARAADAAEQASEVNEEISRLRKENMARLEQRELLAPQLLTAEDEYAKAIGAAHARDETLANLRGARSRLHASQRAVEDETTELTSERDDMNLIGRQADWGLRALCGR